MHYSFRCDTVINNWWDLGTTGRETDSDVSYTLAYTSYVSLALLETSSSVQDCQNRDQTMLVALLQLVYCRTEQVQSIVPYAFRVLGTLGHYMFICCAPFPVILHPFIVT